MNLKIAAFVRGDDERGRLIRRALTRYINLMAALVFRVRLPKKMGVG